jgi:hypothetical protein
VVEAAVVVLTMAGPSLWRFATFELAKRIQVLVLLIVAKAWLRSMLSSSGVRVMIESNLKYETPMGSERIG